MQISKSKAASGPDILLDRIRAEFPDLAWKSYVMVSDGWDHDVIILDNSIVFRFPNDEAYAASLATEIKALGKLMPRLHANVPHYTYITKDNSFAGYPIVPGDSLTKHNFDALNKSSAEKVTEQLADLLSSLHLTDRNDAAFRDIPASYIPDEQVKVRRLAVQYLPTVLSASDVKLVDEILGEVDRIIQQPTPTALIHGDIYSNHLFWDSENQRLGLIDFSEMSIADPAIDFAELFEYGKLFVEAVYRKYTAPRDSSFLERAWAYQRWVGVYMMTDHFVYPKTSFEIARETFDRVKANSK